MLPLGLSRSAAGVAESARAVGAESGTVLLWHSLGAECLFEPGMFKYFRSVGAPMPARHAW